MLDGLALQADVALQPLADALGFPIDTIKFIICIFLGYPLGILIRLLPGARIRHIYSIVVSVLLLLVCFGGDSVFHFFAGPTIVYALMQFLPSSMVPKLSFVVMMGYLSGIHLYTMFTSWLVYKQDISTAAMVTTIKVTMFAYNYRDGKVLQDPSSPKDALHPQWKENAILAMPSLLEFYSYLCYFPTFLTGPAFHFKTYKDFIEDRLFVHEKFNPSGKAPSTLIPALYVLGQAILSLVIHVLLSTLYPVAAIYTPDAFSGSFFLYPLFYGYLAILGLRCRYYFAWKLSEGAGVLSGLGFNGYSRDGKATWDRLCNAFILHIEMAGNVRELTQYWNAATGDWLKNYVYLRTASSASGKVPTWALYLTNTVSAFWHGFYPGYYIAFIKASFDIDVLRRVRSTIRPWFTKKSSDGTEHGRYPLKYTYDFFGWICMAISFTSGLGHFAGLTIEKCWVMATNFHYIPYVGPVILLVLTIILEKTQKKEKRAEKKGVEEAKKEK